MTEEIKEILEEISNDENYSNFIDSQNGGAEYYLLLEKIEGKQLVNYITNLQKENEDLRESNHSWQRKLSNYKSRNEKAIGLIKKALIESDITGNGTLSLSNLLNILQGENDD